jgi:DNA-binding transcriptional regulator YdaS (Cro superfamily)
VATLAHYLQRSGETATEFAARAGVSRGLVCNTQQGRPVASAEHAQRIVAATGGEVTLEDLAPRVVELDQPQAPMASWLEIANLSAAELAELAEVGVSTVQSSVRGMRLRNLTVAQRIVAATERRTPGAGLELEDLVCGPGQVPIEIAS